MCGEHYPSISREVLKRGSSPHVRGTHRVERHDFGRTGIIPACAGNTPPRPARWAVTRDHPRMCGEHKHEHVRRHDVRGSSPHVRGTRMRTRTVAYCPGIIPACAGNTLCAVGAVRGVEDHPRMCGEHTKKIAQYQGRLFPHEYFSFTFTLRTSSPSGICSHCSIHVEEYRRKTPPSSL